MRQTSRRSWRLDQTRLVKVAFMSYRNTLQANALKLVGKKLTRHHKCYHRACSGSLTSASMCGANLLEKRVSTI